VSIAPDHTGNTTGDTPAVRPASIYHLRSGDVSTALDALGTAPVTGFLASPADATRVVLSGHSFGSHTVWASSGARFDLARIRGRCMADGGAGLPCTDEDLAVFARGVADSRVVASAPMAGALSREWFGPEGHRGVTIPMLALSGSDDPVGAEEQFRSTPEVDLTWVDIRGACHQFFAIGRCDHIPDEDQPRILGAWVLAFARRHVLRDTSMAVVDITEGRTVLSDRVTVQRRNSR
jgi:predicted dienelactone hydrolase